MVCFVNLMTVVVVVVVVIVLLVTSVVLGQPHNYIKEFRLCLVIQWTVCLAVRNTKSGKNGP